MKKGKIVSASKDKCKEKSRELSKEHGKNEISVKKITAIQSSPYHQSIFKNPQKDQQSKGRKKDMDKKQRTIKKYVSVSSSKSKSKTASKGKKLEINKTKKSLHEIYLRSPPILDKKPKNTSLASIIEKLQSGDSKSAQLSLEKKLQEQPKNFMINYYLGKIAQDDNERENAKKYYKECIKINKNKKENLLKYSHCCYYLAKYEDAIQACNTLIENEKNASSQIYLIKGKSEYALSKFGSALDSFTFCIQLNPTNYRYYEYQGDCYKSLGAYQVAINSYKSVLSKLSSGDIGIVRKKLECFQKLGDKVNIQKTKSEISQYQSRFSLKINVKSPQMPSINRKDKDETISKNLSDGSVAETQTFHLPGIYRSKITIEAIQTQISFGNLAKGLEMVNNLIESSDNKFNPIYLQLKAEILFQLEEYSNCESVINQAIKKLQTPYVPFLAFLSPETEQGQTFSSLKNLMVRLKEIRAYTLTEEEDERMMNRRKKCLEQAINVLKCKSNEASIISSLNAIMEESSIGSSRFYQNQTNSIFLLKYLKEILKNWSLHRFSLESLKTTGDIAYNMVKILSKQFSIVPLHVLFYTIREENEGRSFQDVNCEVQRYLEEISSKYPPNEKNLTESVISKFQIQWQDKPKINLFSNLSFFKSYKEVHKAIEQLAHKAEKEYARMGELCHRLCTVNNKGFNLKVGLKLQMNSEGIYEERVLCRIIEKMFKNEINQKKVIMMEKIQVERNKTLYQYFEMISSQWQNIINSIIIEKLNKNEPIQCHVYDLLRAKCMFQSIQDIRQAAETFIQAHHRKQIYLIELDNRLDYKTRDVVLKFKIDEIVGQLQLALEFESVQNKFSHGIYELVRSPFGGFFASFMWFSGFALKENKLFLNERIKWKLKGIEHLQKYIYDEKLKIKVLNAERDKGGKEFILSNFIASKETITGNLSLDGKYLKIVDKKVEYTSSNPSSFVIKIVSGNLVINQGPFDVLIRQENTSIFLHFIYGKLSVMHIENSLDCQCMNIQITGTLGSAQCNQMAENAKVMQQHVYSMLLNHQ